MVRFALTFILFLILALKAHAAPTALRLSIDERSMDAKCKKSVIGFIKELKDLSNDRLIEIAENEKSQDGVTLSCSDENSDKNSDKNNVVRLVVNGEGSHLTIHQTPDGSNFDALDLLEFQKVYFTEKPEIGPQPKPTPEPEFPVPELSSTPASSSKKPAKTLEMALIGAVAGALGGALLSPNRESTGLNALVFGASGALAGGLVSFAF